MGRVGNDIQLHNNGSRRELCFSLMTQERIRSNGDVQLHEEWHNIRVAEMLVETEKIYEGTMVYVQGRLQTKTFVDELRIKRYRTEVIAVSVEVMSIKQNAV